MLQVPDYYGEKIGSMKGYRQWLRDQATYRRKAGAYRNMIFITRLIVSFPTLLLLIRQL
jgi:hypothetical protein